MPDLDITRPETDPVRDWEARTQLGAAKRLRDGVIAPMPDGTRDAIEMLEGWSADVVVFDWLIPAAAIAAELAGVPAAALVHCPYPLPARGAPPLFSGLSPMAGPLGAVRDRLFDRMTRRFWAPGLPVLNGVRAEHGLAPLKDWGDQVLGARADLRDDRARARLLEQSPAPHERPLRGPRVRAVPEGLGVAVARGEHRSARAAQLQHQLHGSGRARPASA